MSNLPALKSLKAMCSGCKYRVDYGDGTFSGCGRHLSSHDFEAHRVQRENVEEYSRRCLTDDELLALDWIQFAPDQWASPARVAEARRAEAKFGGE